MAVQINLIGINKALIYCYPSVPAEYDQATDQLGNQTHLIVFVIELLLFPFMFSGSIDI